MSSEIAVCAARIRITSMRFGVNASVVRSFSKYRMPPSRPCWPTGTHKIEHYRLWFRDQLHGYVSDVLGDRDTLSRPYFNRRQIEQLLAAHRNRVGNHQNAISKIISLELIQRSLISGAYQRSRPQRPIEDTSRIAIGP